MRHRVDSGLLTTSGQVANTRVTELKSNAHIEPVPHHHLVLVKVRWEEKFSGSLEEGSVEVRMRLLSAII